MRLSVLRWILKLRTQYNLYLLHIDAMGHALSNTAVHVNILKIKVIILQINASSIYGKLAVMLLYIQFSVQNRNFQSFSH